MWRAEGFACLLPTQACLVLLHLTLLCSTGVGCFKNWKQDPPPAQRLRLASLWWSGTGPQYLWGALVVISFLYHLGLVLWSFWVSFFSCFTWKCWTGDLEGSFDNWRSFVYNGTFLLLSEGTLGLYPVRAIVCSQWQSSALSVQGCHCRFGTLGWI